MREIKTKVWITRDKYGSYYVWAKKPKVFNRGRYSCFDNNDWLLSACSSLIKKYIPIKRHLKPGSKKIIEAQMIFRVKEE